MYLGSSTKAPFGEQKTATPAKKDDGPTTLEDRLQK